MTRLEKAKFFVRLVSGSQRSHIVAWLKHRDSVSCLRDGIPWIPFDLARHLGGMVRSGWRVFEYGSGASTRFWLNCGASLVVSVEHDPEWHEHVYDSVGSSASLDYRLVTPSARTTVFPVDVSNPSHYASADPRYDSCDFKEYVSQIDEFPDEYFDLILVDGRARPSCIRHAASKVRIGGGIIVDNSDREYYRPSILRHLTEMEEHVYHGLVPIGFALGTSSLFVSKQACRTFEAPG